MFRFVKTILLDKNTKVVKWKDKENGLNATVSFGIKAKNDYLGFVEFIENSNDNPKLEISSEAMATINLKNSSIVREDEFEIFAEKISILIAANKDVKNLIFSYLKSSE